MQNQRASRLIASSLLGLWLALVPLSGAAAETGIPPFIKVGSTYDFQVGGTNLRLNVVALIGEGWIQAKFAVADGKPLYLNLRDIRVIMPVE
jgi:hypothetical protein